MARKDLAIVKLGGSLITYKEKPLTINLEVIDSISNALSKSNIPLILVHGGGSFGHYFADKYGLTTKPSRASAEGVSKTKVSMLELNLKILSCLDKHGMKPYPLPPSNFVELPIKAKRKLFLSLIDHGLTPITYGDVLLRSEGFYVLSGDEIARMLSEVLRPLRVIFLLNVDGVFRDLSQPDSLIEELKPEDLTSIQLKSIDMDVTGGMMFKLKEAIRMAKNGVDVMFINGTKPERILKALKGELLMGTLIRGSKK
ncbi:MAG: isopentenyl phosphate kinase family protein [archaeon]|nr:isopentenyl phosphate kinase family protein [archaeon]